jgi:DNA-binding transcriptional LysR family regulator
MNGEPTVLKQLAKHHLIAAMHQAPWRLDGPSGPQTWDAQSRVTTNSSEVVRELALAGVGIALRSTWDVGEELKAGRLVQVLPQWRGASDIGVYAAWPRSTIVPVNVKALVVHLSKVYGAIPYWDQ